MPATSSKQTRSRAPGVTRRAMERPKPPRIPPLPAPVWRRNSQMKNPTRRIVGRKPSTSVTHSDRPSSGGSALITTFSSASSLVSSAGSMNAGTSVLNFVTSTGLASPGGLNVASLFSSPSIESARELISLTLPSWTWSTKNGWYGTRFRSSGRPVMNESTRFTAKSASTNQKNRLPQGIMGRLDGVGVPRPSGAGSTRQPDSVFGGGGGG